jgi:hypothetical protein
MLSAGALVLLPRDVVEALPERYFSDSTGTREHVEGGPSWRNGKVA